MPWDVEDAETKDEALCGRLDDMSPAMERARNVLVDRVEKNFDTESAAGQAWEPLAPSTIEDRAANGFSAGPILKRSGALRADATSVHEYDAHSAAVGTNDTVGYAKYHASDAPRTKIPLRDFLAVAEEDIVEIERDIIAHIERE